MDTTFAGVLAVGLIAGLVEVAKRLGLSTMWAPPLSLLFGLALSVAYCWAGGATDAKAWLDAVVIGLGLGLSASGLYSGVKATNETIRG